MIQTVMCVTTILAMCLVMYLGYKWGYDTAKKTLYDPANVENEQLKDKCHTLYRDLEQERDQCMQNGSRIMELEEQIKSLTANNEHLVKQLTEFSEAAQQAKAQVTALMNKQIADHEKELQCAGCYYREQLNRDRKDFMDIIAAKETLIQQLHKDLNRYKQMGTDKHEIGFAPANRLCEGGSDEIK